MGWTVRGCEGATPLVRSQASSDGTCLRRTCFKFYADSALNTTEELLELCSRQGMVLGVERFVDHRFNKEYGRWELMVAWAGLRAIENSWEPLATLLQDVPVKVRNYVATTAEDEEIRGQLD
ncbi:hypothetical protein F442_23226 [Phytophthora nicotianae P10297]|uniref:Chromo domain-containing protein n=2 Tax=Phytophthora nicotianae TaxID=4792 RepID=W2XY94_PHYNI|nr:hypothetical protein F444_21386 [Phytophthora nicotianae P1976]ETP27497.1 hypothetical protein F442_23226 [Phytophthora nicotianae P10297]